MKLHVTYKLLITLVFAGLFGLTRGEAQFLLQAPNTTDEHNYKWYEASDTNVVLGTESTYLVTEPGIYFATYEGTLCGKNATEYFIVTYCGDPDSEVTLNIGAGLNSSSNITWEPVVTGNLLSPTVNATEDITTYTAFVNKAGNKIKLSSFTMVCILKESTLTDDYVTTNYGQSVNIDVLANDHNIPTTSGSITINNLPAFGSVTVNTNGTPDNPADDTVIYVPDAGFNGEDLFTYIVTGSANEATVFITVEPSEEIINVVDDIAEVDSAEPDSVVIKVLENDSFTAGAEVLISDVTGTITGTYIINDDETITFTPTQGQEGTEHFAYTVTILNLDGTTRTASGNIVVNVFDSRINRDDIIVYQLLTPNGDGRNDVLQIGNIENFPQNKVRIFNRWGAKIYETNGYGSKGNFFDGTSEAGLTVASNRKLPAGVYYYAIEYIDREGHPRNKAGYFYISDRE